MKKPTIIIRKILRSYRYFILLTALYCLLGCNRGIWLKESLPYFEDFNFLILKGKLKFISQNQKLNLKIQARFERDQKIWISISATLGIEVLRVLIDKNEIAIMNKRNNTYHKYDYDFLSSKLGFNLNFKIIQRLMLAQNSFKGYKIKPNKDISFDNQKIFRENIESLLIQTRVDESDFIDQIFILDTKSKNRIKIKYDHEKDQTVPFLALYSSIYAYIKNQGLFEFTLSLKKIKAKAFQNSINFPFDIPKNILGKHTSKDNLSF